MYGHMVMYTALYGHMVMYTALYGPIDATWPCTALLMPHGPVRPHRPVLAMCGLIDRYWPCAAW